MDFLVTSIAAALTVASSTATRSSMPAQTKSGNIGLSTGGVCSPGDVGCHGDTDEAILYAFEYNFDIFVLVVTLRTLWFAGILLGVTATAVLVWVRERRLSFLAGEYFQFTVLL
ncbi:unnamed protein product [Ectocarpus sp. 13 AM-2016]